ncbi:MAG: peptide deformylase [Gammaproteobacteria bacterium]|nr:peptide deformylase [Gammaproteobacteria bacterium]
MAIRKVLKMGEPSLLEKSKEWEDFDTPDLSSLLQDMWDTMAAENGAGLAAPQIGVNRRVVVFGYQTNPRYPDAPAVPETVLINPVIDMLDEEIESDWEGCLSVPGMRGLVPRFRHIRYRGVDQNGNVVDKQASDFHARVVQHEFDHLNGVLYPQRIENLQFFGFCDALENNACFRKQPCDD